MAEPMLYEIKAGWAAANPTAGDRWAVHASTPEEAMEKFREAERRHREMAERPVPESSQDG